MERVDRLGVIGSSMVFVSIGLSRSITRRTAAALIPLPAMQQFPLLPKLFKRLGNRMFFLLPCLSRPLWQRCHIHLHIRHV